MKRFCKLIICLLCLSFVFSMSSCNDGSIDELYGIYGLSSIYYKTKYDGTYNYADAFDYIILVVNNNDTLDCYMKLHDMDEEVHTYKYKANMSTNSDGKEYVSSITLEKFLVLDDYTDEEKVKANGYTFSEVEEFTFNFGSLTNNLKYKKGSFKFEDSSLITWHYRNNYSKMFKRINDFNLKRAKKKQIRNREERLNKIDSED